MSDETLPAKPADKPQFQQPTGLMPTTIDDTFRLAKALSMAGDMVPKHFQGKPEATMAAIVRGMEIGLAPMQALSNIAVINGRASIWGDALPALMQRAGHTLDVEYDGEGDTLRAIATLTRGDTGASIVRSFSVADAKKAGLWNKQGPWTAYPQRMLAMRARSFACRDGAADALMGLQIVEEMRDAPMKDVTPKPSKVANLVAKARGQDAPTEDGPEGLDLHALNLDDAFPGADEFTEGCKAFENGKQFTDCPYEDPAKATDWCAGWVKAHEFAQQKEIEE